MTPVARHPSNRGGIRPRPDRIPPRFARGGRGQGGFTLLEVMLTVFISAMITLPLLAWMVLGTRTQDRVVRTSARIASRNLLTAYLPKDVASSMSATAGGADCSGGTVTGGTVLLSLVMSGSPSTRVAYVLGPAQPVRPTAATDGRSLWRRECPDGGAVTDETMVIEDAVTPAAGWTSAVECSNRPGAVGDTCGQVTMTFALRDAGTVRTTAVRRIGGPR